MTKQTKSLLQLGALPGARADLPEQAFKRWNPDVRSKAGDSTITVFDPIGENWEGTGVTAKRIAAALRAIGEGDVTVQINSPGGNFFEGVAIYNLLAQHAGRVTVQIVGIAASAASVIAMAGDEIEIAKSGFLMIHNTWVCACGDRHAFVETADFLEPFDRAAADLYAAQSGIDLAEIAAMMDRETWLSSAAAIEKGFADRLIDEAAMIADADRADLGNDAASLSEVGALKKLNVALASGAKMSNSQRRELLAAVKKGGKPSAAPASMPSAAVAEFARAALEKIENL